MQNEVPQSAERRIEMPLDSLISLDEINLAGKRERIRFTLEGVRNRLIELFPKGGLGRLNPGVEGRSVVFTLPYDGTPDPSVDWAKSLVLGRLFPHDAELDVLTF